MLTYEEAKVLHYLRARAGATLEDVERRCLRTTARPWARRVVAELEWLGLVTALPGPPVLVQLTARGAECLAQLAGPAAALA